MQFPAFCDVPNHETGQINLDLYVKSVLLTGLMIWFAGSVADFTQWQQNIEIELIVS